MRMPFATHYSSHHDPRPAADGKLTTVAVAVGNCCMVAGLRNFPREVAGILNGKNGFLLKVRFDRDGSENAHCLGEGVK